MKKLVSLFTFIVITNVAFTQVTLIPDPIFEQELINLGYDAVLAFEKPGY